MIEKMSHLYAHSPFFLCWDDILRCDVIMIVSVTM